MTDTPKRKSEVVDEVDASKKPRVTEDAVEIEEDVGPKPRPPVQKQSIDSQISLEKALEYWSSTEATVDGVLGGYPQVSRVDLIGSSNFLAKLRRQSKRHPTGEKLKKVVDCGAGIGRITDGFLCKVAETVDVVEPVKKFTDQVRATNVGTIFNLGLEQWFPDKDGLGPYDVIWNQWCVGQLTDVQLVEYLKRLPAALSEGGWIVVKENCIAEDGEDVFDETDSSVTRTDAKFRKLFEQAELKILASELQKGFVEMGLYPVRAYALQRR